MKIWREKDKDLNVWVWKANFMHKGKRHRPHAYSKSDLEELIIQRKSNTDRQKVGLDSRAPKVTLKQLFDEHVKTFDLSIKTHRRGKVILESFLKFAGQDTPVEDVETSLLHAFIRSRKKESSLKPESVNKEVGYISAMPRDAPSYFKILSNYSKPKMPWATVPKNSAQRPIYKEERETLLAYMKAPELHPNEKPASREARHEYADMFEIAYHTAMRWGEVHLIEWKMIDWRRSLLILPKEITKTKDSRIVALNSRAREILTRRKDASISIYVFPGKTPDKPRTYYYEGIRRIAKKLKLPFGRDVGFTLHSSKHTALSDVVERTGDMKAAQEIGGHTRATMTQKYLHTDLKRMLDAVEKLVEK